MAKPPPEARRLGLTPIRPPRTQHAQELENERRASAAIAAASAEDNDGKDEELKRLRAELDGYMAALVYGPPRGVRASFLAPFVAAAHARAYASLWQACDSPEARRASPRFPFDSAAEEKSAETIRVRAEAQGLQGVVDGLKGEMDALKTALEGKEAELAALKGAPVEGEKEREVLEGRVKGQQEALKKAQDEVRAGPLSPAWLPLVCAWAGASADAWRRRSWGREESAPEHSRHGLKRDYPRRRAAGRPQEEGRRAREAGRGPHAGRGEAGGDGGGGAGLGRAVGA